MLNKVVDRYTCRKLFCLRILYETFGTMHGLNKVFFEHI